MLLSAVAYTTLLALGFFYVLIGRPFGLASSKASESSLVGA